VRVRVRLRVRVRVRVRARARVRVRVRGLACVGDVLAQVRRGAAERRVGEDGEELDALA